MPIPRTANAPFFNGRYIDDFLNRIVQHANQAGETDLDSMVKYILDYSSDKVKDTIIYMDEFDVDKAQTLKWINAKAALYNLYGSTDKPKEYSEEELKEFCKQSSAKSNFVKLSEVESYLRDFVAIASSLKKRGLITEKRYDYYFLLGLPHSMKDWFLSSAPEQKRTRDDPPSIAESLKILRMRFDKHSLIYEEWNTDKTDQVKSTFNELGNRVTVAVPSQVNVLNEAVGYKAPGAMPPKQVPASHIDELAKKLEALTLAVNTMQERDGGSRRNSQGNMTRRCFICGNPCGQDGVHPIGPRFCPETNSLITDHLITFDAQRSRYIQLDGSDLPQVPKGWSGGVAAYLRHLRTSVGPAAPSGSSGRDEPPHMRSTHSVGLMYDDSEVLSGNGFSLDSFPYEYISNPSTRSGLDTSKRLDPRTQVNHPERYKRSDQTPAESPKVVPPTNPVPVPQPPMQQPTQQVRFAPNLTIMPALPNPNPKTTFPPPQNPINTNQGWKGSRPGVPRGGNRDVEMQEVDKNKSSNNPQYHFTSKVQDFADPQSMISRIGDMRVEVPLFQLLGLSPQLSKLMSENTRTKREYGVPKEGNTRKAESSPYIPPYDPYEAREQERAALSAVEVFVDKDDEVLEDFVFRCSSGVAQIPTNRFFAMTVGDVRVSINGSEFPAMIDSGSEMNVAGKHLPEAASLPMDFDGMRWSLKGINGNYERLRGCAVDAPMVIGGHKFNHHIFISRQSIGRHDIILGQPFLQEFSAHLDYERGNHCKLFLWADGDRNTHPTLMISVTDPNDPRNASAIRLGSDAKPTSSYIEETYDSDSDLGFQY
ncbi:hypothetical protein F5051DRAFT_341238 [Lentinula edodes]|nr:hypothetical protein F5051DRAFT_341238 [Lentinula edodes]